MTGTRIATFALASLGVGRACQRAARRSRSGESLSQSYRGSQARNVEYQKIAPFKVMDNLYYVGPGSVAVWLIPTTQGLILIDTAQEPYVDYRHRQHPQGRLRSEEHQVHPSQPRPSRSLRRRREIQKLSGARVALLGRRLGLHGDAAGRRDQHGQAPKPGDEPPAKRDMVLKEGDTIKLGDTSLKVYIMPGHTPGSRAWDVHRVRQQEAVQGARLRRPRPAQRRRRRHRVPRQRRAPREGVRRHTRSPSTSTAS